MKIHGIGTDIVSVDRIKKSLKNNNFISRIFSKQEISKCKKLCHILARGRLKDILDFVSLKILKKREIMQ